VERALKMAMARINDLKVASSQLPNLSSTPSCYAQLHQVVSL
jgi:hypothetical protein